MEHKFPECCLSRGLCGVSLNFERNGHQIRLVDADNGKGGTRTLDPGIMSAVL
jgi:hypothetical protein